MGFLETLADELFVQILSDLPNSDLASTSLVSRRLRNISQPLLYRAPHLLISDQHPTSFDLFCGTLFTPACKFLGTHARSLTIDWKSDHLRHDYCDLPILTAARVRCLLGDTPISEIRQAFLLVQLMPRLQELHLPLLHEPEITSCWPYPLDLTVLPPTLRDFTYEWHAPSNLIDLHNLLTILQLPRIRSILLGEIAGYGFPHGDTILTDNAAGTSSLTHLTIRSGIIALPQLRTILSIPCALTHFVYQPSVPYTCFDFAAFGLALLPLKHSLTSLHVDPRMVDPQWHRHRPTTAIGSLRDWMALRSVTCMLPMLLGRDNQELAAVLPAGIRELEILHNEFVPVGEAVKEVVGLLGAAEMVPALERVRVYAGRAKSKKLRRRLRRACWAVGVAFEDGWVFEGSERVVSMYR